MIRNERQYRVSTTQRERLAGDLAQLESADAPEWVKEASRVEMNAQIVELDAELSDYVALRDHSRPFSSEVTQLADLPRTLIEARIASHMTQKELAERLSLREQQIQRYEANDYAGASVARLQEVMAALDVTFRGEVALPPKSGNGAALKRVLSSLGLSSDVINRRFYGAAASGRSGAGWMNAAARAARVFSVDAAGLLSGSVPSLANAGAFRTTSVANRELLNGYAHYAEYLARMLVSVCTVPYTSLPDATAIRSQLGGRLAEEPFESLLELCWTHGVPVLPLSDPGAFHGACWWIDGRPVIALKHPTRSVDRWAFLLGHEMDHARHPDEAAVLEAELSVKEWRSLPAERRGDDFASELLLGEKAEAMVHVAVSEAHNEVANLKSVLPAVAAAGHVSLGILADHVANRISNGEINWWPTANRLHSTTTDAWLIARNSLFNYVDLSRLDSLDLEIFIDGVGP
ncbi:MAG: helix-turn-helix transcriptional regulator [Actinomycetales bacterium]